MTNEILCIPNKPDNERDVVAEVWKDRGGEVIRIGKFWERPPIDNRRVTIYGHDTFSLVLAQVIDVELISPKDEIIGDLDSRWTKRKIDILAISELDEDDFPVFIKPVIPKTFTSRVYSSYEDFALTTAGIDREELVIRSEIIEIRAEVRAFVLKGECLDAAIYEGSAEMDEATRFLFEFLDAHKYELPETYVVDIGFNDKDRWFIIEFNASWGAGLNSCQAQKVIDGIRKATVNSTT